MEGLLISLLLAPFQALVWLGLPVALALLVWRYMPDCRAKRILFTSWGHDRGPWMAEPWQRRRRERLRAARRALAPRQR